MQRDLRKLQAVRMTHVEDRAVAGAASAVVDEATEAVVEGLAAADGELCLLFFIFPVR